LFFWKKSYPQMTQMSADGMGLGFERVLGEREKAWMTAFAGMTW